MNINDHQQIESLRMIRWHNQIGAEVESVLPLLTKIFPGTQSRDLVIMWAFMILNDFNGFHTFDIYLNLI